MGRSGLACYVAPGASALLKHGMTHLAFCVRAFTSVFHLPCICCSSSRLQVLPCVGQAVVKKKVAMDNWLASVRSGETLSREVSLANMFNPQVFLNALRQQTSRISDPPVAVDELKLVCMWGEAAGRSRNLGALPCALSGLSLQGALFTSGGALSEAKSDTPTVLSLPSSPLSHNPPPPSALPPLRLDARARTVA